MSLDFLATFSLDADALLHKISAHIGDDLLRYIADADYGYDAQENFDQLHKIRNGRAIAQPLPWPPREVLELTRWSNPESATWAKHSRGLSRADGHLVVAFSCAVLMRAYGDAPTREYCQGYNQTLIQLLSNLQHVDFDTDQATISLLAWLFSQLEEEPDERLFIAVALLNLSVKSEPNLTEKPLADFCRWIIEEEKQVVETLGYGVGGLPNNWLLRTTFFDQRHKKWIAMGVEMSALPLKGEAGDLLRQIGRCLAGEDCTLT